MNLVKPTVGSMVSSSAACCLWFCDVLIVLTCLFFSSSLTCLSLALLSLLRALSRKQKGKKVVLVTRRSLKKANNSEIYTESKAHEEQYFLLRVSDEAGSGSETHESIDNCFVVLSVLLLMRETLYIILWWSIILSCSMLASRKHSSNPPFESTKSKGFPFQTFFLPSFSP